MPALRQQKSAIPGFELALGRLCHYPLLMAKALTKSQIVATLAEKVVITKKQAVKLLDLLADLAYKQAKNSFTLPGIGKLVLVNRAARTMTMQFGPKKGQTVKVPARRVVKFRVAKAVKDAIVPPKKK